MVGASRQAINAIETEKFEPSIWLAYDISQIFGCSIEEVFLFAESQKNQEQTGAGGESWQSGKCDIMMMRYYAKV